MEARPRPTAPHSLQSDLGEAATWIGSLHPDPIPGGLEPVMSQPLSPAVEWKLSGRPWDPLETLLLFLHMKHILPGT